MTKIKEHTDELVDLAKCVGKNSASMKSTNRTHSTLSAHRRLIFIAVGNMQSMPTIFCLREAILRNASPYFVESIDNKHMGHSQGLLRFPEDEPETWQLILYWIVNHKMPRSFLKEENMLLMCRGWIAAGEYLMPELQDVLMRYLVEGLEKRGWWITLKVALEVFKKTFPDSPLRKVAAEELIFCIYEGRERMTKADLGAFDRVIGIGASQEPYLVAESQLCSVSEYFIGALRNDNLGDNGKGTLRFHEDDTHAWEILLFWISKHKLPSELQKPNRPEELLVRCWILGDKYLLPAFQDLVMLELLRVADESLQMSTINIAFQGTSPDSKLRQLVAEELVYGLYKTRNIKIKEVDILDGSTGLAGSICTAVTLAVDSLLTVDGQTHFGNFEARVLPGVVKHQRWKRFLIGDAPQCHWLRSTWKEDPKEDVDQTAT